MYNQLYLHIYTITFYEQRFQYYINWIVCFQYQRRGQQMKKELNSARWWNIQKSSERKQNFLYKVNKILWTRTYCLCVCVCLCKSMAHWYSPISMHLHSNLLKWETQKRLYHHNGALFTRAVFSLSLSSSLLRMNVTRDCYTIASTLHY